MRHSRYGLRGYVALAAAKAPGAGSLGTATNDTVVARTGTDGPVGVGDSSILAGTFWDGAISMGSNVCATTSFTGVGQPQGTAGTKC